METQDRFCGDLGSLFDLHLLNGLQNCHSKLNSGESCSELIRNSSLFPIPSPSQMQIGKKWSIQNVLLTSLERAKKRKKSFFPFLYWLSLILPSLHFPSAVDLTGSRKTKNLWANPVDPSHITIPTPSPCIKLLRLLFLVPFSPARNH